MLMSSGGESDKLAGSSLVETYGAKPRNSGQLVRLGRRYLADQVAEGHALGLQVAAWLLVLSRTLADFQRACRPRSALVNDDGVLAESDQIDLPGPRRRSVGPAAPNHQ
jgi:hypothetical protein